jgi:hypothetical protein
MEETVAELKQQIQELRAFVMNELNAIKTAPPKVVDFIRPSILEVAFPIADRHQTE